MKIKYITKCFTDFFQFGRVLYEDTRLPEKFNVFMPHPLLQIPSPCKLNISHDWPRMPFLAQY